MNTHGLGALFCCLPLLLADNRMNLLKTVLLNGHRADAVLVALHGQLLGSALITHVRQSAAAALHERAQRSELLLLRRQLLSRFEKPLGGLAQVASAIIEVNASSATYGRLTVHAISLSRTADMFLMWIVTTCKQLHSVSADDVDRVSHALTGRSVLDAWRHLGTVTNHVDRVTAIRTLIQQLLSLMEPHLVVLAGNLDLSKAWCSWPLPSTSSDSAREIGLMLHIRVDGGHVVSLVTQRWIIQCSACSICLETSLASATKALRSISHDASRIGLP